MNDKTTPAPGHKCELCSKPCDCGGRSFACDYCQKCRDADLPPTTPDALKACPNGHELFLVNPSMVRDREDKIFCRECTFTADLTDWNKRPDNADLLNLLKACEKISDCTPFSDDVDRPILEGIEEAVSAVKRPYPRPAPPEGDGWTDLVCGNCQWTRRTKDIIERCPMCRERLLRYPPRPSDGGLDTRQLAEQIVERYGLNIHPSDAKTMVEEILSTDLSRPGSAGRDVVERAQAFIDKYPPAVMRKGEGFYVFTDQNGLTALLSEFTQQETAALGARLAEAEEVIRNTAEPLDYLRRKAEAEGSLLHGGGAMQLLNNASWRSTFAKDYIDKFLAHPETKGETK